MKLFLLNKGNIHECDTLEEFVNCYEPYYFLSNEEKSKGITRLTKSSDYIENDVIVPLLDKIELEPYEVKQILAWKTGKINIKKSEEKKNSYSEDSWGKGEELPEFAYLTYSGGFAAVYKIYAIMFRICREICNINLLIIIKFRI